MKRLLELAFVLAMLCGIPGQAHSTVTIELEVTGLCIRASDPIDLSLATFNRDQRALLAAALQQNVVQFCIPFSLIAIGFDELLEELRPEECISSELGTFCRNVPSPIPERTCDGAAAGAMCTIPLAPGFGGLGGSLNGQCTGPTASGGRCALPSMTPEAMFLTTLERVPAGDRASTQFALQFLFGDDFGQKILSLVSYLNKIRKSCAEGLGEGDLCALIPPGVCQDGFCVSFCAAGVENFVECLLVLDTVRRVTESVQEDRCADAGGDVDHDNVCDFQDNCPGIANQDQTDSNGDGVGDACACSQGRMGDADQDGSDDCIDPCLLPREPFGPFIPNVGALNCGCRPAAITGRGQQRSWSGGPGTTGQPHLDVLRCPLSADAPATEGPFLLRDVTRQAISASLPGHLHNGRLGNGLSAALSQEIVTSIEGRGIGSKTTAAEWANASVLRDQAAVDAQIYAQLFYDFLRTINTGDGGQTLVSISDPAATPFASMKSLIGGGRRPGVAAFFTTAFPNFMVTFPDPEPGNRFASAASDVVGHEWGHAFTTLAPRNNIRSRVDGGLGTSFDELCLGQQCVSKAQAVEEAFADWIATTFEFAIRGRTGKEGNFRVGEDIAALAGAGATDLANPRLFNKPDHVQHTFYRTNCRFNTSDAGSKISRACSGPYEKAFHLLAVGGTFPDAAARSAGGHTNGGVAVTGVSLPIAGRIAFRANQFLWSANAIDRTYVSGMIAAADQISGGDQSLVNSTVKAFQAVGLLEQVVTVNPVITPSGTGTAIITPLGSTVATSVYQDRDTAVVRASPATGRMLQSITINFNDGSPPDVRTASPASFLVRPGVTVTVRFQ